MKYLNGECYVEVEDHRYKIHQTEILENMINTNYNSTEDLIKNYKN